NDRRTPVVQRTSHGCLLHRTSAWRDATLEADVCPIHRATWISAQIRPTPFIAASPASSPACSFQQGCGSLQRRPTLSRRSAFEHSKKDGICPDNPQVL